MLDVGLMQTHREVFLKNYIGGNYQSLGIGMKQDFCQDAGLTPLGQWNLAIGRQIYEHEF